MARLTRFLGAYYAYIFLFDFILCYAIYTAYFELRGLSYFEIGALLAIWSGSALFLEMLSGALSDLLDRRWLLVAAPLIKILTFVAWVLADGNFWLYALGFVLWSAGQALFSGTHEALLYERLEAEGQSDVFDRHYGRASAMESVAVGTGVLIGGFVAAYSMDLSIWLSIPPLVAAGICALWLVDVRRTGRAGKPGEPENAPGYLENFKVAFSELRGTPQLRFLLVYIAIGLVLFEELEEFDQLFYLAVDLPVFLFGVAGAAGLGLHAAASTQAYRLAGHEAFAWILPAVAGAGLVVAALGGNVYYVIVLELAYLAAVPAAVQAEASFQRAMTGRSRATVTSALYFVQNIMALMIALIFGWLADRLGVLPGYGWAGVCLFPVAVWVWFQQRRGLRAF